MANKYKYQFVSPPPNDVECPLCLDIIEESHQFNCCGHHICRKCGDDLKQQATDTRCPICRHYECTMSPDKYFERNTINTLLIWCTESCNKKVELGQLQNHLKQCPCVQEGCSYGCGQQYQRQYMRKHKRECPKRPFDCCYCGYQSTHEVIFNEHHPICDKYLINCPNECSGYEIERRFLQDHLDKCSLQIVECEFSHFGCQEKLRRCDLPQHLSDKAVQHAVLSSKMIYDSMQILSKKLENLECAVANISDVVCGNVVKIVTMTDFTQKKNSKVQWFSPAYFTYLQHGYKMCFKVDLTVGSSSNIYDTTSLRIYSHMMSGPYDYYLQWPFKGKVIVRLLNQCGDHHHYDYIFDYKAVSNGKKVTSGADNLGEQLTSQSTRPLPLYQLHYNDDTDCQYLKNDCILFKVIVPS